MSQRFVYVMTGGGFTRVGVSVNPSERYPHGTFPFELIITAMIPGNWRVQRSALALLDETHERLPGDWFVGEVPQDEARTLLKRAAKNPVKGVGEGKQQNVIRFSPAEQELRSAIYAAASAGNAGELARLEAKLAARDFSEA